MSDYDFELPESLIAQRPVDPRDASRLLIVDRGTGALRDLLFRDLPDLLDPGDLLVMNDTRVRHARLHAHRATGGKIELLLLDELTPGKWKAIARPARRLRDGEELTILGADGKKIRVHRSDETTIIVEGLSSAEVEDLGELPLPPYVKEKLDDDERYQTVLAEVLGSAAAPTAGLHFTPELIKRCKARGVELHTVTLHVGLDTFRPVTAESAEDHEIHSEWYRLPDSTARAIRRTKERGNRVVAVGTTVVRTLETVGTARQEIREVEGWSRLYITPPHEFKIVDAIITNFHLPRTTLLLLVSAFLGRNALLMAYRHAIRAEYRFYSFGDAMLIL